MNKKQFSNGMKILTKAGFPNTPRLDRDFLYIWYLFFCKYDYVSFIQAVLLYVSNNTFFPTVNTLREYLKPKDKYPKVDYIWETFKLAGAKQCHPLIREAFKVAGISSRYMKEITTDTAIRIVKPRVERIYKNLIADIEDQKQLEDIGKVIKIIDYKKIEQIEG